MKVTVISIILDNLNVHQYRWRDSLSTDKTTNKRPKPFQPECERREVLPRHIDCRVSSRDLSEMRAQLEVAQTGSQTERCDN